MDWLHYARIKAGRRSWNDWRSGSDQILPDLSDADLRGCDLSGYNFHWTLFRRANLSDANLEDANLSKAKLSEAKLTGARLRRANLKESDLTNANLDSSYLEKADLRKANLQCASLRSADLSDANLSETTLIATILLRAKLLRTDLTGACIKDWNIGSDTDIDNVKCDYIYFNYVEVNTKQVFKFWLGNSNKRKAFTDRRPSDPRSIFSQKEFSTLMQSVFETIDLVFSEGVDWKVFLSSFQDLQKRYDSASLYVRAIERKDKAFVVRLSGTDLSKKAEIESVQKELYDTKLMLVRSKGQVDVYRDLTEVVKTLALSPKYDLSQTKFGGGFSTEGSFQSDGTISEGPQLRDLPEAITARIQAVLNQSKRQNLSGQSLIKRSAESLLQQAKKEPALLGNIAMEAKEIIRDLEKPTTTKNGQLILNEDIKAVVVEALNLLGLSIS